MIKKIQLKTPDGLSKFLEKLVEISVEDAMDPIRENERARQETQVDASADFKASKNEDDKDVEEAEDTSTEDASQEAPKKDTTKLGSADKTKKKAEVPGPEEVMSADLNDIIAKLNVMRSGKSLDDEGIKSSLEEYFDSLSSGERQSLYVFLSGLSQIMSSGVSGKAAPDPGEVGIKVSTQDPEPTAKAPESQGPKPSKKIDPASDTPIVVGESIDKKALLRKVKQLMS